MQSPSTILHAIRSLSPDDRRAVFHSISEEFPDAYLGDDEVPTQDQIDELDRRVAEFERNPESAISWEDFEKELTQRFGVL